MVEVLTVLKPVPTGNLCCLLLFPLRLVGYNSAFWGVTMSCILKGGRAMLSPDPVLMERTSQPRTDGLATSEPSCKDILGTHMEGKGAAKLVHNVYIC